MLNKKMAGRVPLENVSEEQKQNGRTRFERRLRIFEITRLLKKEPPGRKITLKINKWALLKETACNKMKSTTYPYHVVLVPKTKTTDNEREINNYPCGIKKKKRSDSSRGHKTSTPDGCVINWFGFNLQI
jgi:hypothetical protein